MGHAFAMGKAAEHTSPASEATLQDALGRSAVTSPVCDEVPEGASECSQTPKEIAVFDFDGTCIDGNSPVLLVKYLLKKGKVRMSVLLRILAWGIAYKTHLPQNEAWVRSLVFASFEGMDKDEADKEMYQFYDDWIATHIRQDALAVMQGHLDAGREVWFVSATFDPIIVRARRDIPFDHHVATKMKVDEQGRYTRQVEGRPVEGAEKLRQIEAHADEVYGKGNWHLAYAYGDHYSDAVLLAAADHPCAVTPGPTLQRHAEKEGWEIAHWK